MATPSHTARKPSASTSAAHPPSRPTTPLRPPSRTSLRASQTTPSNPAFAHSGNNGDAPLAALEPAFAELSDSMADLELNFTHLQLLNESLGRFNECFGAFLYGMNMSAFTVDFPEAPIPQSFARAAAQQSPSSTRMPGQSPFRDSRTKNPEGTAHDVDATFLTTDTSFVENPTSSKPSTRYSSVPPSALSDRRGGAHASARGRARGARAGGASGIGRGGTAGRGASGTTRGRASVARGRGGR